MMDAVTRRSVGSRRPFHIFLIMKKLFFIFLLFVLPFVANAQNKYGYFSYDSIFYAMPEYIAAQKSLDDLRSKYDAEMKRAASEFNSKYEIFLEEQRDLVPSILRKRQLELQDMMDKNIAFKKEAARLLDEARHDLYAPIRRRIHDAVRKVGSTQSFSVILNTDSDACPYIDPAVGEDVTSQLKAILNIN